jgi:hypothetical protein
MFWLLLGMAVLVFAPCVIVPVWMDTEELIRTEADAAAAIGRLEQQIAAQVRLETALRSDPLVNERIARQELRYGRPDENILPGAAENPTDLPSRQMPAVAPPSESSPAITPPPAWTQSVRPWLPSLPWVELFGKPPNRTIFLLMAGGLLVAAFVLYGHNEQEGDAAPPSVRTSR